MADDPKEPDEGTQPGEPVDEPLGENGLKALREEREARKALERELADLKPLADKFREAEEAQKSELQKAADRATEAEAKATKAAAEAMRYRIATRHSISDEDAEVFLTGTDEDSLTKQAERLVELRGEQKPTPKPDPSQGPRPDAAPDPWAAGKARAQAMFGDPGK